MPSKLMLKLAGSLLATKARDGLARSALKSKRFISALPATSARVRVGAVQLALTWTASAESYAEVMHAYALRAAQDGAQLLVYPEYAGLHLLGLLPGIEKLSEDKTLEAGLAALGDGLTMGELLRTVSSAAHNIYLETFSTLAAGFKVTIVAGSIIVAEGRELYNLLHVFGPDGTLLGTQKKTHLSPDLERLWGLSVGHQIELFELPFGKLAATLSTDHRCFEPQRLAWLRGAEILVDASAQATPYNDFEQRRGVWSRVQENPCYGILASLVGQVASITFSGKSGIYAPLALTPNDDGIITESRQADQPEVVVAELDMDALRTFGQDGYAELNLDMIRKYIPSSYHVLWERNPLQKR